MQNKSIIPISLLLLVTFMVFGLEDLRSQTTANPRVEYTIVRLYLNAPKTKYLENIITTSKVKKEVLLAEKNLIKHQIDRDLYIKNIISSFSNKYSSTPVLFMPDYYSKNLYAEQQSGIFLNISGKVDSTIVLNSNNYIIIGRGSRDDDFLVLGRTGTPYGLPFPHKIKQSFLTRIKSLFSNNFDAVVTRLNNVVGRNIKN